jgi:hypothetical protein
MLGSCAVLMLACELAAWIYTTSPGLSPYTLVVVVGNCVSRYDKTHRDKRDFPLQSYGTYSHSSISAAPIVSIW